MASEIGIGDLVGMSFGDGFGREEMTIEHGVPHWQLERKEDRPGTMLPGPMPSTTAMRKKAGQSAPGNPS